MRWVVMGGLSMLLLMLVFYGLGYLFARGFHRAGIHKKVCDICWRDIEQVNAFLKENDTLRNANKEEL